MTSKEMKEAWTSVSFSNCKWWEYPIAVFMAAWSVATCALGGHAYETFKIGTRCIWCGKRKQ
jgi:hypothetical protein